MEDYTFSSLMSELISNHTRNVLTSKKKLRSKYKFSNVNEVLERADCQLKKFGMTLVGLEDNNTRGSYKNTEKVHIVLLEEMNNEESEVVQPIFKHLVIILSIIYFEKNHITHTKLTTMTKDYINTVILDTLKSKNYIAYKEENEQSFVVFGWRYYLEFQDFDPAKIINVMKANRMLQ